MKTPDKEKIELFIQEFGFDDLEEIGEVEEIEDCDEEMAINLGYVYCNHFEVYFKKNNVMYSKEEKEILEYLRGL